jgi:hypothetical protein
MPSNIFDVPDALIAHVVQATAYGQNTQTANQLLSMARPKAPPANATLSQQQIDLIMVAIDTHFDNATSLATQWEAGNPLLEANSIKDQVTGVFHGFQRFARHMDVEYKVLIEAAYANNNGHVADKLRRLKGTLAILLAENKGAKTSVAEYQSQLADALSVFERDYQNVLSELGTVSGAINGLKVKIESLQNNIAENNAEVLNSFLDTAGTEIEQGVALAGAVAEENPGEAVSAGVQMGVASIKGLVKIIELNDKTLNDLLAIRELKKQISEDEVILVVLLNIGTMLASLGATRGLPLNIIGDIIDYWAQLDDHITLLLQQHPNDLVAQIDITNFSPATEDDKNPAFPPWDILQPLDRAARVFNKILTLQPTIFGDNTQFTKLGAS